MKTIYCNIDYLVGITVNEELTKIETYKYYPPTNRKFFFKTIKEKEIFFLDVDKQYNSLDNLLNDNKNMLWKDDCPWLKPHVKLHFMNGMEITKYFNTPNEIKMFLNKEIFERKPELKDKLVS